MMIRSSGILLPIQSLASRSGIGDLGPEAHRFIAFLHDAGQHVWQILPVNPTLPRYGHSPYHSPSAFAFNPLLIDPFQLVTDGFLKKGDIQDLLPAETSRVDYGAAARIKEPLFRRAHERFRPDTRFADFCRQNAAWIEDYALFAALGHHFQTDKWHRWPEPLRNRNADALEAAKNRFSRSMSFTRFVQYLFYRQWTAFKKRCNDMGIQIMGDLPVYVPHESADVWAHPNLFKLDAHMRPHAVSGVPPDYFSKTGQRWGHPVFRWTAHRETGFNWWMRRIRHNLGLYDYLRIDHFRGLVAYWEIPADETTAENGKWIKSPARAFFNTLFQQVPCPAIVAEDLGYITAEVREIIREYKIPGMRVLVFGFTDPPAENPNAPHNVDPNSVVYTGTHDTNTARGWFDDEAGKTGRTRVFNYFGRNMTPQAFVDTLIRTALMSPAWLCITPMQDLLGLGSEARINRPGSEAGNWQWRLAREQVNASLAAKLRQMTETFGRR